jgi:hypothetical protein
LCVRTCIEWPLAYKPTHKKKEKTDWQSAQYKESNGGKNAIERNKTREADEIKLTVKVIE